MSKICTNAHAAKKCDRIWASLQTSAWTDECVILHRARGWRMWVISGSLFAGPLFCRYKWIWRGTVRVQGSFPIKMYAFIEYCVARTIVVRNFNTISFYFCFAINAKSIFKSFHVSWLLSIAQHQRTKSNCGAHPLFLCFARIIYAAARILCNILRCAFLLCLDFF